MKETTNNESTMEGAMNKDTTMKETTDNEITMEGVTDEEDEEEFYPIREV